MKLARLRLVTAVLAVLASFLPARSQMTVSSLDGPVTSTELASFKSYYATLQPVVWQNTTNMANEYAQGHTGEEIKALGLMYEMTGDTAILDRMIYFCDVLLEERNDILAAPYGQRTAWTGTMAPVWPGNTTDPASADAANGDSVGHLAYCARLILQSTSILSSTPGVADVYGHGATYGARAATFVAEADITVQNFFISNLLNLATSNHYFYSSASPYQTGQNLPWNQQMMITYGLENLAQAHAILGDNPTYVTQYDGIVQANFNWFFGNSAVETTYTDAAGNSAYNWAYAPSANSGEDSNHGALDVAGYYRGYLIGRYGITSTMMAPFANAICDVMALNFGTYSGRVDGTTGTGHGDSTSYVRSAYLYAADFRPDQYYQLMSADLSAGGTSISTDTFSRFLWIKNRRALNGYAVQFSPTPGYSTGSQTVTLSSTTSGASIRYTTNGSTPSATAGTLYSTPFTVAATTVIKAISYKTGTTDSAVSTATYTVAAAAPTYSPAAGNYTSSQSVTLSSATSGAAIYYTLDGSAPSATNGTHYTTSVAVTAAETLTAVAIPTSGTKSRFSTADYNIGPVAAVPTISPAAGSYSAAQTVTLSTGTTGATIYYTTNGTTPTTSSLAYSAPFPVIGNATVKAISGGTGFSPSAAASAAYTIAGTVGTPTISPAAGTYGTNQPITLTSSTSDATILFTLDGSAPNTTTGMVYIYTKPFTLPASATVKAYAYVTGMNNGSISSTTYTITPLPSGWSDLDIGTPPLTGGASYAAATFTLSGCGADVYGTSDQFNYAYTSATGDNTLTAKVNTLTNTNAWSKSGVMFRTTTDAASAFVDVVASESKGIAMQYRTTSGGSAANIAGLATAVVPYWVRLVRSGNSFSGYSSPDGTTWTLVGTVTLSMPSTGTAGLLACSHNTASLNTTTLSNVTLVPVAASPTFTPAAGSYAGTQSVTLASATNGVSFRYTTDGSTPSKTVGTVYTGAFNVSASETVKAIAYETGYSDSVVSSAAYTITSALTGVDIGTPPVAGSTSFSAGTYTVSGCGADMYGTADQFQYAYKSASGDLTVIAKVATQTNTNGWAKTGVMIRASTAAGSAFVDVTVTPSNGVDMQYRASTGASAVDLARVAGAVAPYWVKLVRSSNSFTGYCSADGVTWTTVGSISVTMTTGVDAGLAVCSHNTASASTVTFTNVSIQ